MLPNHDSPPLDDEQKNAYRYLIYRAMLEIRRIQWITHSPIRLLNPFALWRKLSGASRAGAIANWMHNLALASSKDFMDFNEEWFWKECDGYYREFRISYYRDVFDQRLKELRARNGKQPTETLG